MNRLEIFPTIFYETNIDPRLAFDILEDIKSKKTRIDLVHESTQITPVSDYSTDFIEPIDVPLFDQHVVPQLINEFKEMDVSLEIGNKWVSCYTGPDGCHPMHIHAKRFSGVPEFSAILYLTSIGYTDFFNTTLHSDQYQHSIESQVGKIVFFPSIIPHQYRAERFDGNHRYTLPFNVILHGLK